MEASSSDTCMANNVVAVMHLLHCLVLSVVVFPLCLNECTVSRYFPDEMLIAISRCLNWDHATKQASIS